MKSRRFTAEADYTRGYARKFIGGLASSCARSVPACAESSVLLSCARDGTEVVAAAATAQACFLWSPSLEALRARAPAYMPERVCGVSDKGPLITGGRGGGGSGAGIRL